MAESGNTATAADRATFAGQVFGSSWRVVVRRPHGSAGELDEAMLRRVVDEALAATDARLSAWREDSLLERCHDRPARAPCPLDAPTARVMERGLAVVVASDGALDLSLGPLLALWGLSPATKGRAMPEPTEAALAEALRRIGPDAVRVVDGHLFRRADDVHVDVGAITDGAAAEAVLLALRARGFSDLLVDVAGEIVVAGDAGGRAWAVGVEDPRADAPRVLVDVPLPTRGGGTRALSTSGTTRFRPVVGGREVPHLLDPRQGRPTTSDLLACTVVGDDVVVVDGLSTACMVLGRADCAALLRHFPDAEALWIFADGHRETTTDFPAPLN